jgi:hypothetical protein
MFTARHAVETKAEQIVLKRLAGLAEEKFIASSPL